MRVYLAGSSQEKDRASARKVELAREGHEVVSTWHDLEYEPGSDRDETATRRFAIAVRCIDELRSADVVWLLAPSTFSIGAWVELGVAIQAGKPLIVSGAGAHDTAFTELADACCLLDDEAFDALEVLYGENKK